MTNTDTSCTVDTTNLYFNLPFKKVFICLPLNELSGRTVEERVNDISEKLMKFYHDKAICDVHYIEPTDKPTVEFLGKALTKIADSELVIFGGGWFACKYCSMVHRILNEYLDVEYMYEWELDVPVVLHEITKRH